MIPLGNRGIIRVQEVTERTNLGIDVVVTRTRVITPPDYEIWEKSEGGEAHTGGRRQGDRPHGHPAGP